MNTYQIKAAFVQIGGAAADASRALLRFSGPISDFKPPSLPRPWPTRVRRCGAHAWSRPVVRRFLRRAERGAGRAWRLAVPVLCGSASGALDVCHTWPKQILSFAGLASLCAIFSQRYLFDLRFLSGCPVGLSSDTTKLFGLSICLFDFVQIYIELEKQLLICGT